MIIKYIGMFIWLILVNIQTEKCFMKQGIHYVNKIIKHHFFMIFIPINTLNYLTKPSIISY